MGKFHLTVRAAEDLKEIWNYTLQEWSESQADEYYFMLIKTCENVASFPYFLGKTYNEVMEGLRGFKAGSHILFYRLLKNDDIEIIRILHERMDLPKR